MGIVISKLRRVAALVRLTAPLTLAAIVGLALVATQAGAYSGTASGTIASANLNGTGIDEALINVPAGACGLAANSDDLYWAAPA